MKNKFLGRDKEINHLFEAFNYVVQKNTEGLYLGPRIVSIISESGLGKSRLVQELYCRIANTELYNPSAFNYWPKEFNDNDVNLQVTPKMDLQDPKGPPKFLWVGARWPPVNERNQASRDSVFPEIKQDLSIHESIIRKMSPAWLEFWNRTTSVIKADFPGEIRGQVTGDIIKFALDMSVPFSGLISGVIKNTVEMAIDRSQAKEDYTAIKEAKSKDEVEEMLGIFTKLLSDKHAIPIVLWLDDAHWADDLMQSFIHRLVFKAKEKKWPLLVVITHWLREYNEQITEINPTALSNIIKYHPNDTIELAKIDHSCLVTYVNENLPGITQSQMDLLCDKCDGNFLSMVENVGLLLSQPRYFNNRDTMSFINDIGIEKITNWESDRQRRVKQRFDSLEPMALQDALALGADQGVRFLPELIIKHLENEGIELSDGMTDFDKCIVPFSIITKHDGSPDIREFKDKLYLKVSLEHFGEFHKNDIHANSSISKWDVLVKQWLTQQINDCFDSAGNIIEATEQKLYFINGTQQELHAILALGLNKLDLSCPSDVSIRFTCLLVHARSKEKSWSAIARDTGYVKVWNDIAADFINVVSESVINNTINSSMTAGAYYAALPFASYQCEIYKINIDNSKTNKSLTDLSRSTHRIAAIYKVLGNNKEAQFYFLKSLDLSRHLVYLFNAPENNLNLGKALFDISEFYFNDLDLKEESMKLFDESYEIARNIVKNMSTPDAYDFLGTCIHCNAMIELHAGNYSEALTLALESHAIVMKLHEDLGTNNSLKDVQISLSSISMIYRELGNLSEALTYGLESLAVAKDLAERLDTPDSYDGVSLCLSILALIQESLDNYTESLALNMECLEIHKMLANQLATPGCYRQVANSLNSLSRIQIDLKNLTEALNLRSESLTIQKKLAEQLSTSESYLDVAASLNSLSEIQIDLKNLREALNLRLESLTIQKKLAEQLDTTKSHRDVSASLYIISCINDDLGNLSEALTFGQECLAIRRKIAEQIDTPQSHQNIAIILNYLSRIQVDLENIPEALSLRMESLSIQKKLAKDLGSTESYYDVTETLCFISAVNRNLGNFTQALSFGHECLAVEREIAEQLDTADCHLDIAASLFHLSGIQIELGNSGEARVLGMESLTIARRLAEQLDTPESHEFVDEIETFINSI